MKKKKLIDPGWFKKIESGRAKKPGYPAGRLITGDWQPEKRKPDVKTEVEKAKFTGVKEFLPAPAAEPRIPTTYGDTRIVAMVRDPWTIFVYWEVTPERELAVKREITARGLAISRSLLRIYDTTERPINEENPPPYFDIELKDLADNWYITVKPERSWCVEIGILTTTGVFFALARSNSVFTPRSGVAEIGNEQLRGWMFSPIGRAEKKNK